MFFSSFLAISHRMPFARLQFRAARIVAAAVFGWSALHLPPAAATVRPSVDEAYQRLLEMAYVELAEDQSSPAADAGETIARLLDKKGHNLALQATASLKSLKSNIGHADIQELVAWLLKNDIEFLAEHLYRSAKESNDYYLMTKLNYEFARYHFNNGGYEQGSDYLEAVRIKNALRPVEKDHFNIMQGLLHQHDEQHRKAVPYYKAVAAHSPLYAVAQLNLATVYIRQDWWTDAHIAIEKAIESSEDKNFIDRLHTTLGFSQLQREFYRDSRNSFREVRTASDYRHRALFGLGLAALHQGDHAAALNAFQILNKSEGHHISKVESYLMSAVTLEQMGQLGAAAAGYTEAIVYFNNVLIETKRRLAAVSDDLKRDEWADVQPLIKSTAALRLTTDRIERLELLAGLGFDRAITADLRALIQALRTQRRALVSEQLDSTLTAIEHYQNQARFRLARLHDAAQ